MKGRPRDIEITVGSHVVVKKYLSLDRESRVGRIRSIYSILEQKRVPNIDRLVMFYEEHPTHGSIIFLKPKGVELQPKLAIHVIEAAICVLEALLVRFMTPRSDVAR